MSGSLGGLLSRVAPDTDWNLVAWAGVGYGADLQAIRALGPRHALYLEPHPDLHARLSRRLPPAGHETLLPVALWRSDGIVPFHQVSDPLQSSLLPPARLLRERPNLKVVSDATVHATRLQDLCSGIDLGAGHNLLVLDVCGAERAILEEAPADVLRGFSLVMVHADPLHRAWGDDGGTDTGRGDLAGALADHGFASADREPDGDGWRMFVNPSRMALAPDTGSGNLRVESLSLPTAGDEAKAALEADLEALRHRASELETATGALQSTNAALTAERDSLAASRDALAAERDALAAERDALVGERAALVAARDALASERDDSVRQVQELRGQADASAQARDEMQRARDAIQVELEALQGQVAAEREGTARLEQQLAEARQTVALSVRLQSQHQADLRDLQERYRESQDIQERQRQLLARLSERLGVASRYFHRLAEDRQGEDAAASVEQVRAGNVVERAPPGVKKARTGAPRPAGATGSSRKRGRGSKTEP